jgi:hypothetical protein
MLESLDGLNGGGWGVFIASNHFLAVGWLCCRWAHRTVRWCTGHCTIHCPVRATLAERSGLELLTVEVFCPLAAPDSPVAHRTVRCVLNLQTESAQSTVERSWPLLCCRTGQFGSTPDSPMNYRWRALRKPESGQFARCSARAPDNVWCATGCTNSCMLQTL